MVILYGKFLITLAVKILIPFIILGARPTSTPGPRRDQLVSVGPDAQLCLHYWCPLLYEGATRVRDEITQLCYQDILCPFCHVRCVIAHIHDLGYQVQLDFGYQVLP